MRQDQTIPTNAMRRRLLAGAGATAALSLKDLLFSESAFADQPKRGGTFVYTNTYPNNRMGDARTGRHPHHWLDLNNRSAYNALTWVDENLEVQPELATAWEPSADLRVWDITIREGVSFHDGREMTADDVVSSFRFHQAATGYAKQILNVEKVGKKVRMTLDEPNSEFPYVLAEYHLMIMPAAGKDTIGMSGIGTGPFKIVSLDPKRRIILERNEKYWRAGFPYLDRLEVVSSPGRMEGALNGFRGGLFDAVIGVDPGLLPDLERTPDLKLSLSSSGDQALMVIPKHEGTPLNDKRVRQALALAIDREKIIRIVYGKKAGWVGNDSHLTPANASFLPLQRVHDIARARALLAEAGHPNGVKLPTFYFAATWPEVPRVFQVLAESVKEAGITLPIEQRPSDGYRQWRVEDAEGTRKHRFAYTPAGPRNPGVSLYRLRPDNNESGYWSGPGCDEYMSLYRKSLAEPSEGKRRANYVRMQEILRDEVPTISAGGRRNLLIHKPNVQGMRNHSQFWSMRFDEVWKS